MAAMAAMEANMKKCRLIFPRIFLPTLILMVTLTVSAIGFAAFSEAAPQNQGISVLVDNVRITFDQPPVNMNGRVMVPIRYVVEQMGCSVFWDEQTQTVYINTPGIPLKRTSEKSENINVYVNNDRIFFTDQQPVNVGGRILLPVRFVAERLGHNVSWDERAQTVSITNIVPPDLPGGQMTIHFIDVGQGNAIFIDYGEFEMLIDAGGVEYGRGVVDYIWPLVDGPVEIVLATHPHDDHIGGMPHVLNAFHVNKVIYNGEMPDSEYFRDFDRAVNVTGRENLAVVKDMTIQIGQYAELHIFAPMKTYEKTNNNSVVVMLTYRGTSVLLTGDIEAEAEHDFAYRLPGVNVLQVPHHGSRSSSTAVFLRALRPEYVIISAGRYNPFGHPHKEVMERLLATGATIYGTFKEGTIIMTIDRNGNYTISAATPLSLSNVGGN